LIEQGDGTFERRLSQGRCPKCDTALPELSQIYWPIRCSHCDLVIGRNNESWTEDEESLAMGAGALS